MKTNFGRVSAGEILLLQKTFFSDEEQLIPSAVSVEVKLYDINGTLLAAIQGSNAQVFQPSNSSFQDSFKSGYGVSFSCRIPDHLEGSSDGIPLTAVIEATVKDSNGYLVNLKQHESLELFSDEDTVYGARGCVAILPRSLNLQLVDYSSLQGRKVDLQLYSGNDVVYSLENAQLHGKVTGNKLTVDVPPQLAFQVSPQPYAAMWIVDDVDTHIAPVYMFNPSMSLAMRELHDYVNKNCSDWATRELTFTPEQLAAALYNGACSFNMESPPTNFTMTNARGSMRQFWIMYSASWLLRSQLLNSIETDFSYTNASVTLDVDRASKYQQFADQLDGYLTEKAKAFKTVLAKRGNISGDGSADPSRMARGAMGTVIISVSPVSQTGIGTGLNPFSWRAAFLNGRL